MYDFLENQVICEDMEQIFRSRSSWKEFDQSTVYLTGAAGMIASYIGMFLIYLVEKKQFKIQIYAGIRNPEKANARYGRYLEHPYFHVCAWDVTAPLPQEGLQFDYLIHAASFASPQYYGKQPVETVLPNITGTYWLLEYVRKHPARSILFFSSGSVYGALDQASQIQEASVGKLDHLLTGNFYAESKRCGEMLCRAYWLEHQVPAKSVRIHHTYGPTLDPTGDSRVFAEFVGNVLNDQDIVIKSAGTARRAFCYLADAVAGLLITLLDGENGEAYNLGNPQAYVSISELAELLAGLFPEKKMRVLYEERRDEGYAAGTSVRTSPLDIGKLEALGWKPSTSLSEGFRRTINSLKDK